MMLHDPAQVQECCRLLLEHAEQAQPAVQAGIFRAQRDALCLHFFRPPPLDNDNYYDPDLRGTSHHLAESVRALPPSTFSGETHGLHALADEFASLRRVMFRPDPSDGVPTGFADNLLLHRNGAVHDFEALVRAVLPGRQDLRFAHTLQAALDGRFTRVFHADDEYYLLNPTRPEDLLRRALNGGTVHWLRAHASPAQALPFPELLGHLLRRMELYSGPVFPAYSVERWRRAVHETTWAQSGRPMFAAVAGAGAAEGGDRYCVANVPDDGERAYFLPWPLQSSDAIDGLEPMWAATPTSRLYLNLARFLTPRSAEEAKPLWRL